MNCGCENMREIFPECDKTRWEVQCSSYIEDADNYYTKKQVDDLIESATTSGSCCITPEEVDEKIASAKTEIEAEIPTVPTSNTAFTNDAGYLTEHQQLKTINNESLVGEGNIVISGDCDLTNYYTTAQTVNLVESAVTVVEAEIPSLSGYATEQWVLDKNYITGVDLSDYATKSEIPTVPTSNTAFTNDAGYLTEHQHLKTINNESLVGDGNIVITGGSGSGLTKVEGYSAIVVGQDENKMKLRYFNSDGTSGTTTLLETAPIYGLKIFTNNHIGIDDTIVAKKGWVEDQHYITGVDLSDYVTYEDMSEYIDDVYTKQEVNNLFVTKQYFQKYAVTNTEYNTTIYNLRQEIDSLKAIVSGCCATTGQTYTRWITVPNDYTCSGTTKYAVEKEQTSTDGINWTDTGNTRRGSELEVYSLDCGYAPPTTYKVTMRYTDGTEDKRECDGSDNLRALNPSNWEDISGVTVGTCIHDIGNLCFYGFSGMTSVTLHNAIRKIGKMAFSRCVSLPSITLPNSLTEIGFDAFAHDSSLESIVIPSGVTVLEYGALKFCTSLTSVTLSEGIQSIGNIALAYDDSLTTLTLPSTVTFIDEYAMAYNNALTTVTCLATTPPTLGYQNIFMGDGNLTAIYVPSESVNAYKSAWSEYANKIQAIP